MSDEKKLVTGVQRDFEENEIIVSKTDLKGHLTYVNDVFLRLASYTEKEVLGQPHNMIRHPDMPRCVFKLLWDSIQSNTEIFAYVINRAKNGDHYWVLAHVTPSRDSSGSIIGYHSNRRVAKPETITRVITPLYRELSAAENAHANRKDGLNASIEKMNTVLAESRMEMNEYFLSI